MSYQMIFKRYELKYLLSLRQKNLVQMAMAPHMDPDQYGRTTIRNIYFDTDTYRLVRRSIERPVYKEKLRVRSYGQARPEDPVFVELKKKCDSVVYKRRLALPERQAANWLCKEEKPAVRTQITEEIEYFLDYYHPLRPAVFLSYEREAFYSHYGDDFRVTFDENILCRTEALSLQNGIWGSPLLEDGQVLMEVKTTGGIPLWMTHFLTEQRIFKTSFSKYGAAYRTMLYPEQEGGRLYA